MSLYPENPAGQTFISQDTYASAGAVLSGLGGGGGGPIPEDLTVSSLTAQALLSISTINGTAVSAFTGAVPANLAVSSLTLQGQGSIVLSSDPDYPGRSANLLFESVNQTTEAQGILALNKDYMTGFGLSTIAGLALTALSTGSGTYQPIAVGGIVLGQAYAEDLGGDSASIIYNPLVSSINLNAPNVNISSLVGLSSINATPYFAPRSGIFFMPVGQTTGYYDIPNPPAGISTNAVVLCTLTRPDGASQNYIVNSGVVQGGGAGTNWYIEVVMSSAVVDDNTAVAWTLLAPTCTPGVAGTAPT